MKPLNDLTTQCIRCGFCLEACPTFLETGDERQSPRGRIYLVRSADEGKLKWAADVEPHLDTCLGCRACEPACPSGVEYGQILELARQKIEEEHPHRARRILLDGMTRPGLFKLQLAASKALPGNRMPGLMSNLIAHAPAEADLPKPQRVPDWEPLDVSKLPEIQGEVALLYGCAMRVLYPRVHEATQRLLRRVGFRVHDISAKLGCCGALHAHAGELETAQQLAQGLVDHLPADVPLVVNSAGCGSTIKEYGHLLESENGLGVAQRTFDISEFLLTHGLTERLVEAPEQSVRATYHDACHLAHGQRITQPPRQLLEAIPGWNWTPLPESDLCCGSAGTYNLFQPVMARRLLERKWHAIESTAAQVVVLGNPGCHAWIAQAAREHADRARVLHTAEALEAAFIGLAAFP